MLVERGKTTRRKKDKDRAKTPSDDGTVTWTLCPDSPFSSDGAQWTNVYVEAFVVGFRSDSKVHLPRRTAPTRSEIRPDQKQEPPTLDHIRSTATEQLSSGVNLSPPQSQSRFIRPTIIADGAYPHFEAIQQIYLDFPDISDILISYIVTSTDFVDSARLMGPSASPGDTERSPIRPSIAREV